MSGRYARLFVRVAQVIVLPLVAATILLNVSFYWIGSQQPDPSSGRTFPVQEHGTLYVTPVLGELSLILFFAGLVALVVVVLAGFLKRNSS